MQKEKKKIKYVRIALKEIAFEGSSKWQWIVSGFIALGLSLIICYNVETVTILKTVVGTLNNILISMLAMIFTGYALFQALLTDEMVCEMKKYGSLLEDVNESFLGLFLLYLASIIINFILISILEAIPNDFGMTNDYLKDSTICFIFVFLYGTYIFRILIELRNFAVNIYKIFIAHNQLSILKEAEKQEGSTLYKMLQLQKMLELHLITEDDYKIKHEELLRRM